MELQGALSSKDESLQGGGKVSNLIMTEERYQKMVEQIEDYAILLLDSSGIIQNWNRGVEKIKGYSEDEVVGKHFRLFYLPEDRDAGIPERLIAQAAASGKAMHEGWRLRKDGSSFWGSILITALHDDQNNLIGFVKVTRDLTERKLADDRLAEYSRQLESQAAELERMTKVASHDLQEPLRKLLTLSSLFRRKLMHHADEEDRFLLDRIQAAAERTRILVENVSVYSRLSRPEPVSEINLNDTIGMAVERLWDRIDEQKIKIRTSHLWPVRGNQLQFRYLFFNILDSILNLTENGDEIRIDARLTDGKNSGFVLPEGDEKRLYQVIEIAASLPMDILEKKENIFTAFDFTLNKEDEGKWGLGLILVRKIVKSNRGYIQFLSRPGDLVAFRLLFERIAPRSE